MPLSLSIRKAVRILRNGGVVASPTEGVFGLGCLPDDTRAIERILMIKQRAVSRGLILIASNTGQLRQWIDFDGVFPRSTNGPITWIVPAGTAATRWITGSHSGIAVRVTTHPVAALLCDEAGSALISTSANVSGRPTARNTYVLHRQFRALVDYIVPGQCGMAHGPSEIRNLMSGEIMRRAG